MKPARKRETAADHFRRLDPRGNRISRIFREFELNRPFGFALDHGHPFANTIIPHQVGDS